MKYFALALFVSLGWLYHNWFLWEEPLAPLGIPTALAYHLVLTLVIAVAWAWLLKDLWPRAQDLFTDVGGDRPSNRHRRGRRFGR